MHTSDVVLPRYPPWLCSLCRLSIDCILIDFAFWVEQGGGEWWFNGASTALHTLTYIHPSRKSRVARIAQHLNVVCTTCFDSNRLT